MKVIIATGGTGGHIFPALNVAVKLKRDGHDVQFIGKFGGSVDQIRKKGFDIIELDVYGFTKEKFFVATISMLKSIFYSFKMLSKFKPDAVLGFGGYGSFPIVFAAAVMRVPTLIHEQNVLPGKANRVLANFVKRVAVSFEKSNSIFKRSKTVLTGCPCQYNAKQVERTDLLSKFGLKEDKQTILVFGGSQGSHRINIEFIEALKDLKSRLNVQVIHLCGKADLNDLLKEYKKLDIPFKLSEFMDDIASAYKVSDLVISRAGAGTVTEIALFNVPAVLIPYPYAGYHQKENAIMLEELGIAKMLEEKDLNSESLNAAITQFLPDKINRDETDKRIKEICFPDASTRLVKETLALVK